MISRNEVKYIQSLTHQKGRKETSNFLAEGVKLIDELLNTCPNHIEMIYALEGYIKKVADTHKGVLYKEISEEELNRISQLQTPNQAVAVVRQFSVTLPEKDYKGWLIGLDGIQDPGNMGTIIRLADWFGVKHILCTLDSADVYNTKVVQASMGSIARVAVHTVDLREWLNNYKGSVIGTLLSGTPLHQFSFPGYGMIVIGREGSGIRDEIQPFIQQQVSIPSFGQAESLNAGVATGIVLWELMRGAH